MAKSLHHNFNQKLFKSAVSLSLVLALTGCNMISNPFGNTNKSKAPAPPMTSVMAKDGMADAKSFNTSNLFSDRLKNDDARFDRLERAVQNMRNEFNEVRPSIDRLVAIEKDIQILIDQLESLTVQQNDPMPAPATQAPMSLQAQNTAPAPASAIPAATKQKKQTKSMTAPPVTDGVPAVYNMRLGVHPGKTRMVLDVNAKTSFTADLDNNEKLLVVELPNAKWTAAQQRSFNNPVIASYKVEQMGDNSSMLIVQLKKNSSISYQKALNALQGSGQRLVIDLTH